MKKNEIKLYEFPCTGGKNENLCQHCKIDERGLCKKFGNFAKYYLTPHTKNEWEREIAQKTFDSIYNSVDTLEDNTVFLAFCKQIFRRRRAEVFRSNSKSFEKENLIFESQLRKDEGGDYSLADVKAPDPATDWEVYERALLMRQIRSKLEEMVSKEDHCAKLILQWYTFMEEGLSQKEMAERLNMKQNTFNQKLRRCKEEISICFK